MTREILLRLRALIEKAVRSLDDSDALECVTLFPAWQTGKWYVIGDRVKYDSTLYRVVQDHTSQTDWTPDITPNLYAEVAEPGTIPVWHQPTGAQDAYRIGDKVHYPDENGPVYVCTIDYNIYPPNVAGWELEA